MTGFLLYLTIKERRKTWGLSKHDQLVTTVKATILLVGFSVLWSQRNPQTENSNVHRGFDGRHKKRAAHRFVIDAVTAKKMPVLSCLGAPTHHGLDHSTTTLVARDLIGGKGKHFQEEAGEKAGERFLHFPMTRPTHATLGLPADPATDAVHGNWQ